VSKSDVTVSFSTGCGDAVKEVIQLAKKGKPKPKPKPKPRPKGY